MKKCLIVRIVFLVLLISLVGGGNILNVQAEPLEVLQLLNPELKSGQLLMQALNARKSSRAFSAQELPVEVLSNLLWAAFGVNRSEVERRTAPSALNFQEIDIYVAMEKGLYFYDPKNNYLHQISTEDIRKFTGKQDFTQVAPVNLIYVANYNKMNLDPEHNKFYAATDTGFISQNVYLYCASEGLSTVVLGWVDKPQLAQKMGLKDHQEVILTQPVGYPKK